MSTKLSQIKHKVNSYQNRGHEVSGVLAIDYMQHGTIVTIEVVTPIGARLKAETQFVGYDDTERRLYFTLPEVTPKKFEQFFIESYWLSVTSIGDQGEGSLVRFRNKIEHIITHPIRIFTLEVPETVQLFELRKEIRYQINMSGRIPTQNRTIEVEITDISKHGCRYSIMSVGKTFDIDEEVTLVLTHPLSKKAFELTGTIRNTNKQRSLYYYGVMFDTPGKQIAQTLLAQLIFNGSKLVFNQARSTAK